MFSTRRIKGQERWLSSEEWIIFLQKTTLRSFSVPMLGILQGSVRPALGDPPTPPSGLGEHCTNVYKPTLRYIHNEKQEIVKRYLN